MSVQTKIALSMWTDVCTVLRDNLFTECRDACFSTSHTIPNNIPLRNTRSVCIPMSLTNQQIKRIFDHTNWYKRSRYQLY